MCLLRRGELVENCCEEEGEEKQASSRRGCLRAGVRWRDGRCKRGLCATGIGGQGATGIVVSGEVAASCESGSGMVLFARRMGLALASPQMARLAGWSG